MWFHGNHASFSPKAEFFAICTPSLQVPKLGLQTPFRDGTVQDLSRTVLEISKGGLERRGLQEESFLKELIDSVETGVVPSDVWLDAYNGKWGGSVDPMFEEGAF